VTATATVTVQRSPRPLAPADGKCTRDSCKGYLVPDTDRAGAAADRCAACGAMYRPNVSSAARPARPNGPPPSPHASAAVATTSSATSATSRRCSVPDCPGKWSGVGPCPACAKRAAYLEANLPRRSCQICAGDLGRRAIKYCTLCRELAARVQTEQKRVARLNGTAPAPVARRSRKTSRRSK